MELTETIAFVRRYNAWRRGDQGIEQPQPYQIGQALDALCNHAERLERELDQERQDRKQADLDTIRALGERNDARRELQSEREANEDIRDLLREVYNLTQLPTDKACLHGRALHQIACILDEKTPRRNEAGDPP